MKTLIITVLVLLYGCSYVKWTAVDGTTLTSYSILDNKMIAGSLSDDGKSRHLVLNNLQEDQTTGVSQIVGAAIEAAVKGVKP